MRKHDISGVSRKKLKTRIPCEFYPIGFEEGQQKIWQCARERAKLYKNTPIKVPNKGFHKQAIILIISIEEHQTLMKDLSPLETGNHFQATRRDLLQSSNFIPIVLTVEVYCILNSPKLPIGSVSYTNPLSQTNFALSSFQRIIRLTLIHLVIFL